MPSRHRWSAIQCDPSGHREPRGAKADGGGEDQGKAGAEEKAHDQLPRERLAGFSSVAASVRVVTRLSIKSTERSACSLRGKRINYGVVEEMFSMDERFGRFACQQDLCRQRRRTLQGGIGNRGRVNRRRQAGQGPQFDNRMRVGHDVMPYHRWDGTAGHPLGRCIIVVSHPHRATEIPGVTDEPRITI